MLLIWIPTALALDIYEGDDLFAALSAATAGDEIVVHTGTYSTQSSGGSYYREVVLSGTRARRSCRSPGCAPPTARR